ncbi:hypothetical protein BJ878DRAFT_193747 [Calycina marina]|uniref:Uncharacterized protein n=1 Tax=Calycina marina TaxID=1763456 RepID=A0A9P7YYH2_9HELO|nr:hypothetical protein BJ878DRAFT_193747 [Calycina marina]
MMEKNFGSEKSDYSMAEQLPEVISMEKDRELTLRTREMEENTIRVSRSDLTIDDSPEIRLLSEDENEMRLQLMKLCGSLEFKSATRLSDADHEDIRNADEQAFEFRMFSGMAHKILLREEEGMGGGAFVKLRDPRIFAVPRAGGQRKWDLQQAAISGDEVLEYSKRRAWGLEVPWRVKVVRLPGEGVSQGANIALSLQQQATSGKKTKPNKRLRILLRQRKKREDRLVLQAKLEAIRREEAEREKKSRKNRGKKLKKRAKEKSLKSVGAEVEHNAVTAASGSPD